MRSRKFNILYEIEEASDGGELAEKFLKMFIEDVDGLDYGLLTVEHDMDELSVSASIETPARITDEWFENAVAAVEA